LEVLSHQWPVVQHHPFWVVVVVDPRNLPAKFDRSPARFRNRVENVMEPDTRGLEKLPEESASFGTIQTLINRHEAMLNAIDADAGAAGSLSSGGIGRYNY
jgi:hypothetical protein